jgi:hypothetical protein
MTRFHLLITVLMVAVTVWIAVTGIRIEQLNAQAGYYLPRRDGGADGKWRVSINASPRNELRDVVSGAGLWQYLLAPAVAVVATWLSGQKSTGKALRRCCQVCAAVALVFLSLAWYRGYFTSLGW